MKKLAIALTLFVILAAAYCGAWLYMKKVGDAEIDRLFANAESQGIKFIGPKPHIEGFPFVPTVTYTQGVEVRNWQASFSTLTISGFPLPGFPVSLSFPAGVIAWIDGGREPIALEYLHARFITPWPVPASVHEDDLMMWRDQGGELKISRAEAKYEGMETELEGIVRLDTALQPEGDFIARTKGYAAFIQKMVEMQRIQPFAGVALLAALNNFAQPEPDQKDGEMIAELPLTIHDRGLYVGPILAQELPQIAWGKRSPPALRE